MKFNKESLVKGLSGGLLALMILSNSACDKQTTTMSVNDWLEGQKIGDVNVMDITGYDDEAIPSEWTERGTPVNLQSLPTSFLKEMNVVEDKNDGMYFKDGYYAQESTAYADTKNNKINLIVRLCRYGENGEAFTQYNIQYKVTEEEMQTFLSLDGDFRMRFFIQGLDATHKRNVLDKFDLSLHYHLGAKTADGVHLERGIIMQRVVYYVDAFDSKNKTITYVYQHPYKDKDKLQRCTYALADVSMEEDEVGSYLGYAEMTPGNAEVVASADDGTFIPVLIVGEQINEEYNSNISN